MKKWTDFSWSLSIPRVKNACIVASHNGQYYARLTDQLFTFCP